MFIILLYFTYVLYITTRKYLNILREALNFDAFFRHSYKGVRWWKKLVELGVS